MFCKKCGQQIPDNSTVCPMCGEPIGDAQQVDANQQVQPQQNMNQQVPPQPSMDQQVQPQQNYGYAAPQKKSKKTPIIIGSIIGVLVLIGVVVGILFATGVFGKNYVGTYKFESMTGKDGKTYDKDSKELKMYFGDDEIFTIELKSDGEAKMSGKANSLALEREDRDSMPDMEYEVDGKELTIKNAKNDNKKFKGEIEDDTITIDAGGIEFVLKKDDKD